MIKERLMCRSATTPWFSVSMCYW